MISTDLFGHAAFVIRCSGSATLAYLLASALQVPHPSWAAMTAVIVVTQDNLSETRSAVAWRIAGTIVGIVVAVIVVQVARSLGADRAVEIALAVGICAIIARRYPLLRVCMWTSPVVFLTIDPNTPPFWVGVYRGTEVIIGGLVGAGVHAVMDYARARLATGYSGP